VDEQVVAAWGQPAVQHGPVALNSGLGEVVEAARVEDDVEGLGRLELGHVALAEVDRDSCGIGTVSGRR